MRTIKIKGRAFGDIIKIGESGDIRGVWIALPIADLNSAHFTPAEARRIIAAINKVLKAVERKKR